VVVEGHPSSAPGEGGWRIASASPSPPRSEWQTAPQRVIGQVGPVKETIFYHHDHLGTPFVVTDAEGMVVSRHRYSPFGEELAPEGSNSHTHRFTGHERDTDTGLDYMMARYYGAELGRFLSIDPARDSVDPLNPQSWNRYSYTGNNPIRYIDPDGMHTAENHEEITDLALDNVMSEEALRDVKRGNVATDTVTSFRDTSAAVQNQHGMGGTNLDGSSQTRQQEAEAGTEASATEQLGVAARNLLAGDVTSARENFGNATHTVQDAGADGHQYGLYTGVASTGWREHRAQDRSLTPAERASGIDATRALHGQFTSTFRTAAALSGLDDKAISAALSRFNGR
jgi:RHS repeat-associated protein